MELQWTLNKHEGLWGDPMARNLPLGFIFPPQAPVFFPVWKKL
jgi:hypothetical protein